METYLFKFSLCLLVFWLVYILFLERQTMHRFKRFYLLGAVASALIIPILTITHYIEPIVTDFEVAPLFIPIEPVFTEIPLEQAPFRTLENILWILYGLGALLFSIRFAVNLFKMYRRISNNETIIKRSFVYVLLEEYRIPHSFFKYIFFNKLKYKAHSIPKEVMLHEETHAKQLHSLDVLAVELLQIVFWFNPLIYVMKYHIKMNHEFLADQAVLDQGSDAKTYQNILLQFSSNTQEYQLSSAINYSSIKKRFTVMKTQTSKTRIWVSGLLLLPIIAILYYSFAEKEYVEKENTDLVQNIQDELIKVDSLEMKYAEEATSEMMHEYNDWIIKFNATHHIDYSKYKRIVAIYDIMSGEQKNSVEPYPVVPDINLSKVKPKVPTKVQFESWKNKKEFAIWLDGKHIPNSDLNNYSLKDIAHYVGSKVHKNARSEKFPQPFQFSLYTKQGFKKSYQESLVNSYKTLTKTYSEAIKSYLKGSQTDNSELRIIKVQADKLYNKFTKEDLKKYNILPVPPLPAQKSYTIVQKPIMLILINRHDELLVDDELGTLKSIESKLRKLTKEGKSGSLVSIRYDKETSKEIILKVERLIKQHKFKVASFDESKIPPPPPPKTQEKATAKQVAEYNAWAKQLNTSDNKIIKQKDLKKYKYIYSIMTAEQKKASEAFPKLPPPPPPPPAPKVKKGEPSNIPPPPPPTKAKQYKNGKKKTLNEIIKETPKGVESGYEMLENGESHYYTVNNGKKTYYNKDGYITNKKGDILPPPPPVMAPPPPPAPESTLDFIIRMAKTDAKFFNEGKTISSDKAIDLIKNNPKLNVNGQKTESKQPLIYITKKPILIGVKGKVGEQMSIKVMVNGKTIKSPKLEMTRSEFESLKISTVGGKVTAFKFKIPGKPTQQIKGNAIDLDKVKDLESIKKDDHLVIFDIKDGSELKIEPLVITITD